MAAIARGLGDGAWITDYQSAGTKVMIGVIGDNASRVLQELEATDEIASAKFVAGIQRDEMLGKDRFSLSLEVKRP